MVLTSDTLQYSSTSKGRETYFSCSLLYRVSQALSSMLCVDFPTFILSFVQLKTSLNRAAF